jgi:hypothetical protein
VRPALPGLGQPDDDHRSGSRRGRRPTPRRARAAVTTAEPDLVRDLSDYDRAFGVDLDGQVA